MVEKLEEWWRRRWRNLRSVGGGGGGGGGVVVVCRAPGGVLREEEHVEAGVRGGQPVGVRPVLSDDQLQLGQAAHRDPGVGVVEAGGVGGGGGAGGRSIIL